MPVSAGVYSRLVRVRNYRRSKVDTVSRMLHFAPTTSEHGVVGSRARTLGSRVVRAVASWSLTSTPETAGTKASPGSRQRVVFYRLGRGRVPATAVPTISSGLTHASP